MRLWSVCSAAILALAPATTLAQIDPDARQLVHIGYDASFEGHAPIAAYAFYYLNRPQFLRDDLTLRMAVAPVYFDSELGLAHALGPNTDLGFGVAGGGFADSYREIRGGKYIPRESFDGHSGAASFSVYHRFNPAQRVPLFGMLRGGVRYATYTDTADTAAGFEMPDNYAAANFRAGLRLGGKEPVLYPSLAMELSAWVELLNRGNSGDYGFHHDRPVESASQLYYAFAYLAYTFDRGDNLSVSMTAGQSSDADRFSAYRLGAVLPLVAEYPLMIPGYYYQEITARRFVLWNARYALALDERQRWQLTAMAAAAAVGYLPGQEQPGRWHSGVGGGLSYRSESGIWHTGLSYGYGFNARRDGERGAHVVGLVMQFDVEAYLGKRHGRLFWWK